jgi:hypothetical protein
MSDGQRVAFRRPDGKAVTGTVITAAGDVSRVKVDDDRTGVPMLRNDALTKITEEQYAFHLARVEADRAAAAAAAAAEPAATQ